MAKVNEHISDFISYAEKEKAFSVYTVKSYAGDLNRFDHFMKSYTNDPQWKIDKIDRQTIRHFLGKEFEEGYSSRTVARRLATIKSFCKYLHKNSVVEINPAAAVKTPKVPKHLPTIISKKLIEEMMDYPDIKTPIGIRDRAMLEIFYSTGIRLSELANLNIGNFKRNEHMDGGVVKVVGKGQKERVIPYGRQAEKSLDNYLKKRGMKLETADPNEPCFVNSKGKRLSIRTIQRRVTKYIKQVVDGSSIGPHTLRHSFASNMINNIVEDQTIDIRLLKELLGHSSLSSTQIYTQIQQEKMKEIYKQAHPHGE